MKKHETKFYVRYAQKQTNLLDTIAPKGAIYGRYSENGNQIFWICDCFKIDRNGNLRVYLYKDSEWSIELADANHPIYKWVKTAVNKLGFIPTVVSVRNAKQYNAPTAELMKTYSRHKKGNGSRINNRQINQPLRWNEVTETAHWFGQGNASVIASNIH